MHGTSPLCPLYAIAPCACLDITSKVKKVKLSRYRHADKGEGKYMYLPLIFDLGTG
jgi:hypothetical protein